MNQCNVNLSISPSHYCSQIYPRGILQSDYSVFKRSGNEPKKVDEEIEQCVTSSQTSMANKLCVICYCRLSDQMTESNQEKEITVLACKHAFHLRCFSRWIEVQKVCPLCRKSAQDSTSLSEN